MLKNSCEANTTAIDNLTRTCPWRETQERSIREYDLMITGLVFDQLVERSTLHKIVLQIGLALNYELTSRDIQRVQVRRGKQARSATLIVRFASRAVRDQLFSAYFKKQHLNSSDLNMNLQKTRVYISENLTATLNSLKYAARKLKEAGHLTRVNIYDGKLTVKSPLNDRKWIVIENFDDLKRLEHEVSSRGAASGVSESMDT